MRGIINPRTASIVIGAIYEEIEKTESMFYPYDDLFEYKYSLEMLLFLGENFNSIIDFLGLS
jgi:hypothetical protein